MLPSCTYGERPLESGHTEPSALVSLKPKPRHSTAMAHSRSFRFPNPVGPENQVNRIETRSSTVDAGRTSGTWQLLGDGPAKVSKQRPAIGADVASPGYSRPTETVIFRGENFKTQYYGGSNPTSLIAHVGYLSPLHVYQTDD